MYVIIHNVSSYGLFRGVVDLCKADTVVVSSILWNFVNGENNIALMFPLKIYLRQKMEDSQFLKEKGVRVE